jgi:hypothetical protein
MRKVILDPTKGGLTWSYRKTIVDSEWLWGIVLGGVAMAADLRKKALL